MPYADVTSRRSLHLAGRARRRSGTTERYFELVSVVAHRFDGGAARHHAPEKYRHLRKVAMILRTR